MLEQTFIHIPGIGKRTEQDLWANGIHTWDDADRFEKRFGHVSAGLQRKLDDYIPRSREAMKNKDAGFFERLSALGEAWRIFPDFAQDCVYLDIETTGLSTVFDTVTMVGLYDGRKYELFVDGENLSDLPKHLQQYAVVITFNGAGFDLRFLIYRKIKKQFQRGGHELRSIYPRQGTTSISLQGLRRGGGLICCSRFG